MSEDIVKPSAKAEPKRKGVAKANGVHQAHLASVDTEKPNKQAKALDAAAVLQREFQKAVRHHQQNELEKAIAGYNHVLSMEPRFTDALNNLGVALRKSGKPQSAITCYRRLLALRPNSASALVNLGNVLRETGKFDEALDVYNRALTLEPKSQGALMGLGGMSRDCNWLQQSLDYYDRALQTNPTDAELNWDRALTLLRMGDHKRGWEAYEWRWKLGRHKPRKFEQPEWDGSPLNGRKLYIYAEQGFGDTIQFLRFLPKLISDQKGELILEVRPELIPLIKGQYKGIEAIVARGQKPPAFDVHIPLMSLPRILGTTLATLPRFPYLKPVKGSIQLGRPTKGLRRIGLAWAGSPTNANDKNRTFTLTHLLPLFEDTRLQFVSLQKGRVTQEIAELGMSHILKSYDSVVHNFADTAGIIQDLDLVISADTSVAHLAGALGKPVWIALSVFHDWRFDANGSIAHWYPSIRTFRQDTPGDWEGVFQRIKAQLG